MPAKILIVDDEPATVEMLSIFMQMNDYESVGAYNGTDGLLMIEVEKPDAVILDLMMPDIEGFEVCKRVRAKDSIAHTPIVIMSARTDSDAVSRAYAVGANAYLTKPPNFPELLSELKQLIGAA